MATLSQHNVLTPFLLALIALAWVTLWVWGQSPYGRFLTHEALQGTDASRGGVVLLIVAGWVVMLVAMMLPTSLPLIGMFHRMTRQRSDRTQLVCLLLAGYFLIWTLFGVMAVLGDGVLHTAVERSAWLAAHAWLIGASIFVVAGLYQFTPLKYYCLDKCRSPLSFLMLHWQGRRDRYDALRLGVRHGLFCLGCCWAAMMVLVVFGLMNLDWMAILFVLFFLEKNWKHGCMIANVTGVGLMMLGAAILAQPTLLPAFSN